MSRQELVDQFTTLIDDSDDIDLAIEAWREAITAKIGYAYAVTLALEQFA